MAFATVAAKQVRQAGPVGPTDWQATPLGTTAIELRALMNNPDIRDATLSLTYRVEGSVDGITAYLLIESDWTGGMANRDGSFSPPDQIVSTSPMPAFWRASAVIPRALNLGLEVEAR